MKKVEFIQTHSIATERSLFGEKLPGFDLYTEHKGAFIFKLKVLYRHEPNGPSGCVIKTFLIGIKNGKIEWSGEKKDAEFEKKIEKHAELITKPELLMVKVIDEEMEVLLEEQEKIENEIERIEALVLKGKTKHTMQKIFVSKKNLMRIRNVTKNYLSILGMLTRKNDYADSDATTLYEEILHFDEITENQKEELASLIDAHLNTVSNKMNQVMKVLTIITTLAVPFTAISGIFGMNILLPMQDHNLAFILVILFMVGFAGLLLALFYKMGWIGEKE